MILQLKNLWILNDYSTNKILECKDKRIQVVTVYMNFSKAFGKVAHFMC